MKASQRILIAGIGNIFFGDDAFGCELAGQMSYLAWPEGVEVRDFGIRGIDLAYALLEPYDHVILLDAVARGGPPGTLYLIRPHDGSSPPPSAPAARRPDAYALDPAKVLRLAVSWGAELNDVVLVGCEPQNCGPEEEIPSGLSDAVRSVLDEAEQTVRGLVESCLAEGDVESPRVGELAGHGSVL